MSGPRRRNKPDAPRAPAVAVPRTRPEGTPLVTVPPVWWRDPWAWLSALSVVPLLVASRGAPFGEPVSDDFDFLDRVMFRGIGSLFDGGGSSAFWRPIPHQIYYAALGPTMLAHPLAITAFHTLVLGLATLLLYRAWRTGWSGPLAMVAASFPLLTESGRSLLSWPSHFVDVGQIFFSALALHETTRRRLPSALAALLAALLCKESAVVTGLMLPFLPALGTRRGRGRWIAGSGSVLGAWGIATMVVRNTAHLALPGGLTGASPVAMSFTGKFVWALGGSLKALASLPRLASPADGPALLAILAPLVASAVWLLVSLAARNRLATGGGWLVWGSVWFVLACVSIVPIHPIWAPSRAMFGAIGLGVAVSAFAGAAHPALAAALLAVRLVLLFLAPPAAAIVGRTPPDTGAFTDFEHLTRLQLFMRETRIALQARYPRMPAHAWVAQDNLPLGLTYALGGDKAMRVWYRDSTLRWVLFDEFRRHPDSPVITVVNYQPFVSPEVVLLSPGAALALDSGYVAIQAQNPKGALAAIRRAEALETDPDARLFHATACGLRSWAAFALGERAWARSAAESALAVDRHETNARRVLTDLLLLESRLDEADRQIDTLLVDDPRDSAVLRVREAIAEQRRTGAFGARPRGVGAR